MTWKENVLSLNQKAKANFAQLLRELFQISRSGTKVADVTGNMLEETVPFYICSNSEIIMNQFSNLKSILKFNLMYTTLIVHNIESNHFLLTVGISCMIMGILLLCKDINNKFDNLNKWIFYSAYRGPLIFDSMFSASFSIFLGSSDLNVKYTNFTQN